MLPVGKIAKGFYNNVMKNEEDLFQSRITICRQCKLHKEDPIFGEMCNSKAYLNPMTDELSNIPKIGFYSGCGCVLVAKCRVREEHCPITRW